MTVGTGLALAAEVVANSNSQIAVFTANSFSNLSANGATVRVTGGGWISPGSFGSEQYYPMANINIYCGPLGTNADPLILNVVLSPQSNSSLPGTIDGATGFFGFDTLVTLRGNNVTKVGGNANVVATMIGPYGTQSSPTTNGVVNVSMITGSANTANISVYAVAGPIGQNANLVFESCVITPLTSLF
jgi:hypothetical protein